MKYRLLSVAEVELAEAASWYEDQAAGLGQEFLDEFEVVLDWIMRFPEAWKRIGARSRPARGGRGIKGRMSAQRPGGSGR